MDRRLRSINRLLLRSIRKSDFRSCTTRVNNKSQTQSASSSRSIDTRRNRTPAIDLEKFPPSKIRNFCIIAHVDHGKSTLADRLLEMTGSIERNESNAQVLDTLEIERERGITIKAQTASMLYQPSVSKTDDAGPYLLNLIDTPGHADFSYEVSRSLAACQGALLLVDVSQGIQAQTVANFWLAFEMNVHMIGLLNKIDLVDERRIAEIAAQMENVFDLSDCLRASARMGAGVDRVLDAVVERIPPPDSQLDAPLRALIFDSWFDQFRGCYLIVLVKDGHLKRGQSITAMHTGKEYEVQEVGILRPAPTVVPVLYAGQVGYVTANVRHPRETHVGDTLCWTRDYRPPIIDQSTTTILSSNPADHPLESSTSSTSASSSPIVHPLPGFRQLKPMVFSGLYPVDPGDYDSLKLALSKLSLTDPSVTLASDHSSALGAGWRCGFLGVLHMEVFNQRLEREFDATTIMTAPSVPYKARIKDNEGIRRRYNNQSEITVIDPSKFPEIATDIDMYLEPVVECTAIVPLEYSTSVRSLIANRRGLMLNESMIDSVVLNRSQSTDHHASSPSASSSNAKASPEAPVTNSAISSPTTDGNSIGRSSILSSSASSNRLLFKFRLPLIEVITNFVGALKRVTSGYASFDYDSDSPEYQAADLVKVRIAINDRSIDEFARIVLRDEARAIGQEICEKLKKEIPRQQYEIEIKAQIGTKTVAKSMVKPIRKDFAGKLKGNFGDHTRLKKLLDRQAEGKKKMKVFGNVEIPKEAFFSVFNEN